MSKEAWAHNEWLRMYIEKPEDFEAEFQTVYGFLEDTSEGRAPSHGERCEAFFNSLLERAPETELARENDFQDFDPDW